MRSPPGRRTRLGRHEAGTSRCAPPARGHQARSARIFTNNLSPQKARVMLPAAPAAGATENDPWPSYSRCGRPVALNDQPASAIASGVRPTIRSYASGSVAPSLMITSTRALAPIPRADLIDGSAATASAAAKPATPDSTGHHWRPSVAPVPQSSHERLDPLVVDRHEGVDARLEDRPCEGRGLPAGEASHEGLQRSGGL